MQARLTRTDSTGDVPTDSFRAEVGDRVREFDVGDGGMIDGDPAVIEQVVDRYAAVEAVEADTEGDSGPEPAVEDVAASEE